MAKKAGPKRTTDANRRKSDRRTSGDRRVGGDRSDASARKAAPTLLIATTNPNKMKEIVTLLDGLSVTLKTLKDFPDVTIAEETGSTFAENARAKALHYAKLTGMLTMAEDSGFEVDALDCEPGIHSARYLEPKATYPERFTAIYEKMRKLGKKSSAARFVCALALVANGKVVFETKGSVEGQLASEPAGDKGFGYDPVFCYSPYGKTFGEVSPKEKAAVSHRGEAIRALRAHLEQNL